MGYPTEGRLDRVVAHEVYPLVAFSPDFAFAPALAISCAVWVLYVRVLPSPPAGSHLPHLRIVVTSLAYLSSHRVTICCVLVLDMPYHAHNLACGPHARTMSEYWALCLGVCESDAAGWRGRRVPRAIIGNGIQPESLDVGPVAFPLPPPAPRLQDHRPAMASHTHSSSSTANIVGVHYRVGKKIGEGSFGVIFEGRSFRPNL